MIDNEQLLESTESYLKALIAEAANTSDSDFDPLAPFGELGIDSFYVLKIVKMLEADFGNLPKTLLFENFNISDLAQYFIKNHQATLMSKFSDELAEQEPANTPPAAATPTQPANTPPVAVIPTPQPAPQPALQPQPTVAAPAAPAAPVVTAAAQAAAAPVVTASAQAAVSTPQPVLILWRDLPADPPLQQLVQSLYDNYKNESSVSRGTKNIAPYLFITASRKGYFNYTRCQQVILAYGYTGEEDYFDQACEEIYQHCQKYALELSILVDKPLQQIGDTQFTATPFGAVQRVLNTQDFALEGKAMRRLRYLVSKFQKAGECVTREYKCGSDPSTDQGICELIDKWCDARSMVNPLVFIAKEEIAAGTFSHEHRIFLTYVDQVLQNAIIITQMAGVDQGYLMDLEFYPTDMPLGGLEYAIVEIIKLLRSEGSNMFSLGATFGPKIAPSENPDPALDQALDTLREQDIFNDAGNLQFKNKFRPENKTIYICRALGQSDADNIIDIIMLIADPAKMQTDDDIARYQGDYAALAAPPLAPAASAPQTSAPQANAPQISTPQISSATGTAMTVPLPRAANLATYGYNPMNLPAEDVEFDLKTDSWAQLTLPAIAKHMGQLRKKLQQPLNIESVLQAIFPFQYFTLAGSGRTAEHFLYKAWQNKGIALQNVLFPTCIFHLIDKGFTPVEVPAAALLQADSEELFKGNLDLAALQAKIAENPSAIAMVVIETSDNAAGGCPVSLEHVKAVKQVLQPHQIPLVMDGTRILENAEFVLQHDHTCQGRDIWAVARELLGEADAIVVSLAKDFCVAKGGLIATNDSQLQQRMQALLHDEGSGLDAIDKKLLGLALQDKRHIETQVLRRKALTAHIWTSLKQQGVPLLGPVGAHCILLDVKQMPEFTGLAQPVPAFLAWLYLNTGIRGGAHSVGMQKQTCINDVVRLAIPVGMQAAQADTLIQRLSEAFASRHNIPDIALEAGAAGVGDIHAKYELRCYHNVVGVDNAAPIPAQQAAIATAIPTAVPPTPAAAPAATAATTPATAPGVAASTAANTDANTAASGAASAVVGDAWQPCDIAIVGMAGRYPKADNVEQLWQNLLAGRDCIEDIPAARVALRRQTEFTQRYRGGFIDAIDKFDPLFFNISPREAEWLDPQERLFLETAYEALEDAGYYPDILGQDEQNRNIGVFVGAVWAMYQILGAEQKLIGTNVSPNSFLWSIANRVSYWMNLSGPSLTLDTACSSSLTAVYLACEAIYRGDCSGAIVGGVNLDIHQTKWDINKAGGALSEDGVCRSFGDGANGYVAGEGVGAIFLKTLEQAVADRDNVHGVIKAVTVNHGGRTSGYTVPSPQVQGELIAEALRRANIDACTIGYIEAHGTGTELGDPIEINGLNNAFEPYRVPLQSVPIGSVKSNIGHLEAAAGVVSICKVLLQMRHGKIAPSLHSQKLNEFIDFEQSPFYVQQDLQDWPPKTIEDVAYPRRAGISSFGAGGANAHVILEQYHYPATAEPQGKQVLPLSARTEEQLQRVAERLRDFVKRDTALPEAEQAQLGNIAYTLQVGRKSFDHRVAVIATSKRDLLDKLGMFIAGQSSKHILSGTVKNAEGITKLLSRREKREFINLLAQRRDPLKLAQLWIEGLLSDWQGFQEQDLTHRISLPTYPFADKRLWAVAADQSATPVAGKAALHPMVDANDSTFDRQVFTKQFTTKDFVIYDHLVSDIPTLPGVAYLELVRKAGELAAKHKVQKIRNILWVSPIAVENGVPLDVNVELIPAGEQVAFEVFSTNQDGSKQLHSQGKLAYATASELAAEDEYIDLAAIQGRVKHVIDGKDAYPLFRQLGLGLGPSFQTLQEVFKNDEETLGRLRLPDFRLGDFQDIILHPSLVDGSLQAGMGAQIGEKVDEMFVPFTIGEVEVMHPLVENCFSYVTEVKDDKKGSGPAAVSKTNVMIVDETGKILVKIKESVGIPLRSVHEEESEKAGEKAGGAAPQPQAAGDDAEFQELYYANAWDVQPLDAAAGKAADVGAMLIFDRDDQLRSRYQGRLTAAGEGAQAVILVKPAEGFADLGDHVYTVDPTSADDFAQLVDAVVENHLGFDKILYAWPQADLISDGELLKPTMEQGLYAFFHLARAIIEKKLDNNVQFVYLYLNGDGLPQPHNEAFNGFARTLQLEHRKLVAKTLEIKQQQPTTDGILDAVLGEFHSSSAAALSVRYDGDVRSVRTLRQYPLEATVAEAGNPLGLKHRGVYIITGGAGGLGLIFAEALASQCQARLVLTGRSALSAEREAQIEQLRATGSEVLYLPADVSKRAEVAALVDKTRAQFGAINGIIHSAGVIRDSFVKNKTLREMQQVLAPKLDGTVYLDQLTSDDDLDFMVLFSSLAATGGNMGQCDYAYANHFMDTFAQRRELQVARGERSGRSLSINWSLWQSGGMQLDEQTELMFRQNLGIKPLSTAVGVAAFGKGLNAPTTQLAVLEGVQEKIELAWGLRKKEQAVAEVAVDGTVSEGANEAVNAGAAAPAAGDDDELVTLVRDELTAVVQDFLKLDASDVSIDTILLDLGFDSIGLTTFANLINERYGLDITPVTFFEYPTLREVSAHIGSEHPDAVRGYHQLAATSAPANNAPLTAEPAATTSAGPVSFGKAWTPQTEPMSTAVAPADGVGFDAERRFVARPMAVVGIGGKMPMSDNMQEFWENLRDEVNMITVIPRDRWDWEDYYGDPLKEKNVSNSKWGGFMRQVDTFDPLFFGVSPREAEMMDPQQRLFLESVWAAIEDSGQRISDLAGTNTGLFVGVATNDYIDVMNGSGVELDGYTASGNSHSVLANRVSFLLNISGPSAPLDTACSSSLIAIHRALESIHTGSCEMAIVGGVQVMLSPAAYISFGIAGMLADDGKCKTFDARADGYVRGEGSGAIFIKPLDMAEADNNHIYAVIKATAENHGGKAAALTAPNPAAQADLLIQAYTKAEVDPRHIGFIECHGTGTSLGDPIEIQALKKTFAELYKARGLAAPTTQHCGLTSAKTNIGHLETAAGIAGVLKSLLAIRNKAIPALVHFQELNPYISLQGSPLYIVERTTEWVAPQDEQGNDLPRVCGVSSFGFGGANAHVVLQEYVSAAPATTQSRPLLLVLSAKRAERLQAYANNLLQHIEKHQPNLVDLTYTMQVGRDPMEHRVAILADEPATLLHKLRAFVNGEQQLEDVYVGFVKGNREDFGSFGVDSAKARNALLASWLEDKLYAPMLEAWSQGMQVDWSLLYQHSLPRRVSAPTYPFGQDRYWFHSGEASNSSGSLAVLHPLVHQNTSRLGETRFSTTFTGKEAFLCDISTAQAAQPACKLLAPATTLEMVRAAIAHASDGDMALDIELCDLNWQQDLLVSPEHTFHLTLLEDEHGEVEFEVSSTTGQEATEQPQMHCYGAIVQGCSTANNTLDIEHLQVQMDRGQISTAALYESLAEMGMHYRQVQQTVTQIWCGREQQLVQLRRTAAAPADPEQWALDPLLLEGAVQAAVGFVTQLRNPSGQPVLPQTLASLNVLAPCPSELFAWIRYARGSQPADALVQLDIDLLDSAGALCVSMKSLAFDNRGFGAAPSALRHDFESLLQAVADGSTSATEQPADAQQAFEQLLENLY